MGLDEKGGEAGGRTTRLADVNWARSRDIVVTLVGGAAMVYVLGVILAHLITLVLVFVLSAVVAFTLAPLVGRLQRLGVRRGGATAAVYGGFLLVLAGALVGIGGGLATQFSQLNEQLPLYSRRLQEQGMPSLQLWLAELHLPLDLSQLDREAGTALQSIGAGIVGEGLSLVTGLTDVLVNFVLVVVISLYLVLDGQKIRDRLDLVVPPPLQRPALFVETSLVRVLGGYIRGQLLMAAIIGLSSGLGCWLLGVQYPLVIGVLAFFFELIPMIGPVLAAIPAVIVSVFQPFPLVLVVIGFFVVMQLVESNVLGPRITGHAVGLHPIASILALVGGAEVAGLWGALFAVPVVGLAVVLGMAALNELRGRPVDEVVRPRKSWKVARPRRPAER
jgi:predicted PurR-regulated permease PerM